MIYVLYVDKYFYVMGKSGLVGKVIMVFVVVNGVLEVIVGVLVVVVVVIVFKKSKK